jgi:hypothetical protein
MCPACLAIVAWVAAGGAAASGFATAFAKTVRKRGGEAITRLPKIGAAREPSGGMSASPTKNR